MSKNDKNPPRRLRTEATRGLPTVAAAGLPTHRPPPLLIGLVAAAASCGAQQGHPQQRPQPHSPPLLPPSLSTSGALLGMVAGDRGRARSAPFEGGSGETHPGSTAPRRRSQAGCGCQGAVASHLLAPDDVWVAFSKPVAGRPQQGRPLSLPPGTGSTAGRRCAADFGIWGCWYACDGPATCAPSLRSRPTAGTTTTRRTPWPLIVIALSELCCPGWLLLLVAEGQRVGSLLEGRHVGAAAPPPTSRCSLQR